MDIALGTPPQALSLVLTTNSPWVAVSTPECFDCFSDRDFNTSKSSSFQGTTRRIVLDNFEVSVAEDNVTFPGHQQVQANKQKIMLIKKSPFLDNIQAEGVLVSST